MWMAVATDTTHVCDSMGTEKTWIIWRKFFRSAAKAKEYCVRDYEERAHVRKAAVLWEEESENRYSSPDLLCVMYDVVKIETEDGQE